MDFGFRYPGGMSELRDVTESSFEEDVLNSSTPSLIDFWGDH